MYARAFCSSNEKPKQNRKIKMKALWVLRLEFMHKKNMVKSRVANQESTTQIKQPTINGSARHLMMSFLCNLKNLSTQKIDKL